MSGKDWTAHDIFIAMIALKFSRQSYNFKEDNLLDAAAYIGAWQNYIDKNSGLTEEILHQMADQVTRLVPTPPKK